MRLNEKEMTILYSSVLSPLKNTSQKLDFEI